MHEITFLRHGESLGLERNILQGHIDLPLTELGRHKVLALALAWEKQGIRFDQVFSSPLERARQTAEIVCSRLNLSYTLDPDWIERNFGAAEGVDNAQVASWYEGRPHPTAYEPFYESGESDWEIHLRAGRAVDRLLKQPPGSCLVVAHGSIIGAALRMIFGVLPTGRSRPVELLLLPGCFARVAYNPASARWSLSSFNDQSFLVPG